MIRRARFCRRGSTADRVQVRSLGEGLAWHAEDPWSGLRSDTRQAGFTMNAAQVVDPVLVGQLQALPRLAHEAVTTRLSSLASCARARRAKPAPTVHRRFRCQGLPPATSRRRGRRPTGALQLGADGATFNDGIELVISSILQSAGFLYITEIGDGAATEFTMSQYEDRGAALVPLLGCVPPDGDLLTAAKAGTLADPAVREKQARRPDRRWRQDADRPRGERVARHRQARRHRQRLHQVPRFPALASGR